MVVTHKLSLDLTHWSPAPRIDIMQDDKYSRNLEIQMLANGVDYCPPEGCSVLIRYHKIDHTSGAYDVLPDGTAAWTIEGNLLIIRLAPQVCTKDGPVKLVITLFSGQSELNCFELELFVWKNPKGIYSSRKYVNITGFIPQPTSAAVGQYLEVAAVDECGRITAVDAVDAPGGSTAVDLPENIVTADLTDAEDTESDTVPVNADTLGGFLPDEYLRHGAVTATLQQNMGTVTDCILPLTPAVIVGDCFESSGNGIKCLKDGNVLLSASIMFHNGASEKYLGIWIQQEDGSWVADHFGWIGGDYGVLGMASRLISVYAGEVLVLKARCSDVTMNSTARTHMTLVYI